MAMSHTSLHFFVLSFVLAYAYAYTYAYVTSENQTSLKVYSYIAPQKLLL